VIFVAAVVALSAGSVLADQVPQWVTAATTDGADYYFYESVELVEQRPDSLLMRSVSGVSRDLGPVTWEDALYCGVPGDKAVYSSQSITQDVTARPLESVEWHYVAPVPPWSGTCEMRSVAYFSVRGVPMSVRVTSGPFTVG